MLVLAPSSGEVCMSATIPYEHKKPVTSSSLLVCGWDGNDNGVNATENSPFVELVGEHNTLLSSWHNFKEPKITVENKSKNILLYAPGCSTESSPRNVFRFAESVLPGSVKGASLLPQRLEERYRNAPTIMLEFTSPAEASLFMRLLVRKKRTGALPKKYNNFWGYYIHKDYYRRNEKVLIEMRRQNSGHKSSHKNSKLIL